jgi:hypothetical protein
LDNVGEIGWSPEADFNGFTESDRPLELRFGDSSLLRLEFGDDDSVSWVSHNEIWEAGVDPMRRPFTSREDRWSRVMDFPSEEMSELDDLFLKVCF